MAMPIDGNVVVNFVGKSIGEFANAYFAQVANPTERINQATQAVRNAGFGVNQGQIFAPRVKKPDVEILTTRGNVQFLRIKGKFSQAPNARAGMSISLFPSDYAQGFSATLFAYGLGGRGQQQNQQPQGKNVRVNVNKTDIAFEPDGSMTLKIRIYPDRNMLMMAQNWIAQVPVGSKIGQPRQQYQPQQQYAQQGAPVAVPGAQADCMGYYNPQEPECQQCADAAACSRTPVPT